MTYPIIQTVERVAKIRKWIVLSSIILVLLVFPVFLFAMRLEIESDKPIMTTLFILVFLAYTSAVGLCGIEIFMYFPSRHFPSRVADSLRLFEQISPDALIVLPKIALARKGDIILILYYGGGIMALKFLNLKEELWVPKIRLLRKPTLREKLTWIRHRRAQLRQIETTNFVNIEGIYTFPVNNHQYVTGKAMGYFIFHIIKTPTVLLKILETLQKEFADKFTAPEKDTSKIIEKFLTTNQLAISSCPNCNQKIFPNTKFCTHCGKALK
ncbi:MAG: zinc ribbon domain-containing protein [Promethearchaeota archaeon]